MIEGGKIKMADDPHVCIECGASASMLYKEYNSSLLKLWQCESCKKFVDKYIEYDNSLVFMDVVLQKIPAIRHILYNSEFKKFWKLGVVCLLCNAYIKYVHYKTRDQKSDDLYFEVEFTFYYMCLCSVAEFGVHILIIVSLMQLWPARNRSFNTKKLLEGLVFADFGQLFGIPAIIWSQSRSQVYFFLTTTFIVLSNIQMYQAVCLVSKWKASAVILMGFVGRILLGHALDAT